jgi:hypothetical protein
MRRYILLTGVLALLCAALGCQHVGGKCDCGFNPNDYPITGPTPPFPTYPAPAVKTMPKTGGNE